MSDLTIKKTDTFLEEIIQKTEFASEVDPSGNDVCIRKYRQNWMDVVIVSLRNERKSSERLSIFFPVWLAGVRLGYSNYIFSNISGKKDKWLRCRPALPKTLLGKIVYYKVILSFLEWRAAP